MSSDRTNIAIIIVNLDPHGAHEDTVELPLAELGISADSGYSLEEAFTGRAFACRGAHQRFHLDPASNPALVFCLRRPYRVRE
jgi:starch synthase (maltosyl-transferring)